MNSQEKITAELLREWEACKEGYKRFCELFPDGADLETAANGLADDGHADWGLWLYNHCRDAKLFSEVTAKGFQNTGHWNTGDQNTGDWNTGDRNTGDQNTGDWNTGDQNTGDRNTGDRNTGHRNTGDQNTGHWNTGDQNTGFFNTITPIDVLVFNKPVKRKVFEDAYKPIFLFFNLTYWVHESKMTDAEKVADPNFYARGGQLRKKEYKQAFIESWGKADKKDRERVRDLPNFDAQIFFEISGIDLR
jgi:Pentapeptide repeats (8 copies)